MDLSQLSNLIIFATTPAAVSLILSNVLDNIPEFVALSGQVKSLLVLALSIVLGIVAYIISNNVSPDLLAKIQPYYSIVFVMVSAWLSGQIAHQFNIRGQLTKAKIKHLTQSYKLQFQPNTTTNGAAVTTTFTNSKGEIEIDVKEVG